MKNLINVFIVVGVVGSATGYPACGGYSGYSGYPARLQNFKKLKTCDPEVLRSKNHDVLWYTNPKNRQCISYTLKVRAAEEEKERPTLHFTTNGDELRYKPQFWGQFSKTLPHDGYTGRVDPYAYKAFLRAMDTGKPEDMNAVPTGAQGAKWISPFGAATFMTYGPDLSAINIKPPPSISSVQFAGSLTQVYWMALLRDVPFASYVKEAAKPRSLVSKAIADLQEYVNAHAFDNFYPSPVTPQNLFRVNYPGVLDGPMVSQILMVDFSYDGIPVDARIRKPAKKDFLTEWDHYIDAQNRGSSSDNQIPYEEGKRIYPHKARDLGYIAGSDFLQSAFFRALIKLTNIAPDPNNPYNEGSGVLGVRSTGFTTFGFGNFARLMGAVHLAVKHAWWQKWSIHRYIRPEEGGALVEAVVSGRDSTIPLDPSIFHTRVIKILEKTFGSRLVPQMFPEGGPNFPAYPASHGVVAGACVTVLKAVYDTTRPWTDLGFGPPVFSKKGKRREVYHGPKYESPLTIGGELNKLAHNVAFGRDMSGIHFNFDAVNGNLLGEEIAIRILREEKAGYTQPFTHWNLQKFDGTWIKV